MLSEDDAALRVLLNALREEHRDLDMAIQALEDNVGMHDLQIRRLKKKKLDLKDQIARVELKLTPDIIA